MKSPLVILSLLAASLVGAQAQEQYFHRGAQYFLAGSNDLAKAEVARGLQLHPDHPNLTKFWELLNQQSQQQQNQDDKQEKQDQNKDQQKEQDQKSKEQEKQQQKEDQQKKDGQDPQQQQQPKPDDQKEQQGSKKDQNDDKKGEQQAGQAQKKPEGEEGNPDGQPQGVATVRMTPQQAVRLLESMKAEEQTLQFRPILKTNRNQRLLKDW